MSSAAIDVIAGDLSPTPADYPEYQALLQDKFLEQRYFTIAWVRSSQKIRRVGNYTDAVRIFAYIIKYGARWIIIWREGEENSYAWSHKQGDRYGELSSSLSLYSSQITELILNNKAIYNMHAFVCIHVSFL